MALKVFLAIMAILAGAVVYNCLMKETPRPPALDPREWWGPKQLQGKTSDKIEKFQIKFGEQMISDLKERLRNHRTFAAPLEGVGFQYGFNTKQLDSWIKYWSEKYDFKAREEFLNKFPQYKTNIQGLDIHFIRVKPQVAANIKVVPLALFHGWPGSVREFYEAIPLLTTPRVGQDFVFEVIVPSLPGYGFSDAAVRPGLAVTKVAVIMRNLMKRLGFQQYYVQGGDWGSAIASALSTMYPEEVLGHHNNLLAVRSSCNMVKTILGSFFPSLVVDSAVEDRLYPLGEHMSRLVEESGYFHLQSTKPDTIGVALSDSPAGLLAYILEKFSTWTVLENKKKLDGGLTEKFTREQLLDNLMLYWSTNSITTSMRLYAESMSSEHRALTWDNVKTDVPTWAFQTKHEIMYQPEHMLKAKYTNLLGVTVLQDGGHFLALELPKIFADDVFKAVKAFREFHDKKNKTEL